MSQLRSAATIARREMRGGLKSFRIFLTCLALGVAAIAAVGSVRMAIEQGLTQEASTILGGDAEMEFTYRFASDAEREWMVQTAETVSEITDFRSMAVVRSGDQTDRALTQIKGVDDLYPLYGSVQLEPSMPIAEALAVTTTRGAVMERVLSDRLGLEIGDTFSLGQNEFELRAILVREPDATGGGFALGPRTLVLNSALEGSGLIQPGTLFESQYRLVLPEGVDLNMLEEEAEGLFRDTGMRWRDRRNGSPGTARFVERIGSFLVLVGLAGLAVGGIGVSAAVRAYLDQKTATIATLKTLGATGSTIFATYFLQIGLLACLGVAIGLTIGVGIPLILGPILSESLPVPTLFDIYTKPLVEAGFYGLLTALIFTLWPLARAREIRAAGLFRDMAAPSRALPRRSYVIATICLVALLIGASAWISGIPTLALWSSAGILASLFVLALAAFAVRHAARSLSGAKISRGRPALRLALGAIGGPGGEAQSVILSLGLGLTVLATVGQIDANIRGLISEELPERAPAYFMVDIQNAQLDGFLETANSESAVTDIETAPMLRGIFTRINGTPAAELVGEHWVLRGDRGVSYSAEKPDDAVLTEGAWWPADYSGPPLLSFAEEEGRELGLSIGDKITINILGRDIEAEIANFRVVDFSTMGINFIMILNQSALAGAPHSHIATVYAEEAGEGALLRSVTDEFPNITAIRVRDAIQRVTEAVGALATATSWGAGATLITGFMVLIGAAAAGERRRVFEAAVLKTLGASRHRILISFALRSAILGLAAGLIAVVAGALACWAVMTFVMDGTFRLHVPSMLIIVGGGILANLIAGLLFAWGPLRARPSRVLRSKD